MFLVKLIVGLLAVEIPKTEDDEILVNEVAPVCHQPLVTILKLVISQFETHVLF
jgi:phosphoribosylaminoimidazole carboxylase (NCAIR synthetase)